MTNKWFRRFMSAFLALALALNPIDTRAFATRALATAPESAGINDMQGKATPGLGALGRGIAGTLGGLLGALGEAAVEEGTEHVGEAVEGAGEVAEGAGEAVGEVAEGAGEAIKGAVEGGATAAEEGTAAAEGAAEQGAATAEEGTTAAEQNAEWEAAEKAAKEKAAKEKDAAYEELKARQEQDRIDAEKQAKDEAAEAARAANNYWEKPETLARHYADHGKGVGATSEEEYTRMAHEFYLNKKQYQVKVDKEGITRVYDAARNLFGAYNPDGTTRTYLAPTGGQAYFDKQGWAMP